MSDSPADATAGSSVDHPRRALRGVGRDKLPRWRELDPLRGRVVRRQQGGFPTKQHALIAAREIETRLALGRLYRPDLTVVELFDRYLAV